MADIVSGIVDFVAANPFPVLLVVLLLAAVLWGYLFLRKTVREFRRGMQGE